MDDAELRQLANAAAQFLRPHLDRSEPLRQAIGLIGKWLCVQARSTNAELHEPATPGAMEQRSTVDPHARDPEPHAVAPTSATAAKPNCVPLPLVPKLPISSAQVPLKIGDHSAVYFPVSGTTAELGRARQTAAEPKVRGEDALTEFIDRPAVDLAMVETRCRLKTASCRHLMRRRAAEAGSDEDVETKRELDKMLVEARAMPNCFLWAFMREHVQPDDGALGLIAENYEAHAEAVSITRRIDESDRGSAGGPPTSADIEAAFHLLAEANSSLRVSLKDTWLPKDDFDQAEVHMWLRRETAARRIFVGRHMTLDGAADPTNVPQLRQRIKQLVQRVDERAWRSKAIKSALSQVRYHAGQLLRSDPDGVPGHWGRIAEAVGRLSGLGIAESDKRLVEALGTDAAALWPAEATELRGLAALVARAKGLELPHDAGEDEEASPQTREWSGLVLEVRTLLRGKQIVVVGGERNAPAVDRLAEAFELTGVEWVSLTEHGPGTAMRAPIHRAGTAVVIVIIKLTGHQHGDEAKAFAAAARKPCVLLSGGYNPERVAKAILDQASDRLRK